MVGSDNVAAVIDPRILGCDLDICSFLVIILCLYSLNYGFLN